MARFRLNPFRPQLKEGQRGTAAKRVLFHGKRYRLEAWHYNAHSELAARRVNGETTTHWWVQLGYIELSLIRRK